MISKKDLSRKNIVIIFLLLIFAGGMLYVGWRFAFRTILSVSNYSKDILEIAGTKCKLLYATPKIDLRNDGSDGIVHAVWVGNLSFLVIGDAHITMNEESLEIYETDFQVLLSEADFSLVDHRSGEVLVSEGKQEIYCISDNGSFLSDGYFIEIILGD
ncbi:MAG: hypothetical protein OEZ01_06680 [Candidatus Heimdallarchaeota archaeon]|nr:hypothetical protein [Anaerolineae bacterium]MDH5645674.1 hypothetical protein [Candidatus Heimdallarchaeota archaeon]